MPIRFITIEKIEKNHDFPSRENMELFLQNAYINCEDNRCLDQLPNLSFPKRFFTYSKQNQSRHFREEMQFIASKSRFIARLEFHQFLSNRICDYLGLKNIRTAFF